MPHNKTVYETTLGRALSIDNVLHALKKQIVVYGDSTSKIKLISSVDFLPLEVLPGSEVPIFGHPMLVENVKGKNYLAIDLRMLVKVDGDENLVVRNQTDYDFAYTRYVMNYAWLNKADGQIRNTLEFAGVVYAHWLSEIISRKFALDPRDQILFSIVSHFFYQSLFGGCEELTEEVKQLMAAKAIRATNAPSDLVLETVDKIVPMSNIAEFCENIKKVLDNIRLKDFNSGVLISSVVSSWYGLSAKEIITMALEHIPTWVSVCYAAITQRTYKNTTINIIGQKYGKRGVAENFMKNYVEIIREFESKEDTASAHLAGSIAHAIEDLEKVTF